jgi:hypothetical protein
MRPLLDAEEGRLMGRGELERSKLGSRFLGGIEMVRRSERS